jgi:hypothetical protein
MTHSYCDAFPFWQGVASDDVFDDINGSNEKLRKNGTRTKELDGGGTIEIHGSTRNPDYPRGTPTVKVQDKNGKVIKTVRFPKDQSQ